MSGKTLLKGEKILKEKSKYQLDLHERNTQSELHNCSKILWHHTSKSAINLLLLLSLFIFILKYS